MSGNEIMHAPQGAISPFGPRSNVPAVNESVNLGSVMIEQERAVAEAQGKMILAKRFPRSMANARAEFMDACADAEFAKAAFYKVQNRGTGPSIRFAEEIARCYGNMDYGHRELSRSEGKSEVEVYAWDMERNNFSRRQITVEHILDTSEGPRKLKNQADIDNRIANIASKQIRGRILALMPKALVQAGIEKAKQTLAGGSEKPISERINGMVEAFKRYGVSVVHIEGYLGHKIDLTTVDELADLIGTFNAIKEGAPASEYFGAQQREEQQAGAASRIAAVAQGATKPAASPAPTQAPAPAPAEAQEAAQGASEAPAATPAPAPAARRSTATKPAATPAPAPTEAPAPAPAATPAPSPAPTPAPTQAPAPAPTQAPAAAPAAAAGDDDGDYF
jgi:hypothetical protein